MSTEKEQRMSTVAEFHLAEVPQYEQDCQIVKHVLIKLVGQIQEAEAEANETGWADEQAELLKDILLRAKWTLDNLAYKIPYHGHLDADDYANHYVTHIPNCLDLHQEGR